MTLEAQIEAVLFYKTDPLQKKELATILHIDEDTLRDALGVLRESLTGRGVRITETDTEVQLVTAPELSEFIDGIRKDELRGDIGKAGAETLAIIMYRGPLSRAEIDKIRGVNSNFILRNLLIRGLIERREHPTDARSFVYAVTPALLNHLGIQGREELPEFSTIMNELDAFEKQDKTEEEANPFHTND